MSLFRLLVVGGAALLALSLSTASSPLAASQGAVADAPFDLHTVEIAGRAVTIAWSPPPAAVPVSYQLEGGFSPGETTGALLLDGDITTFAFESPADLVHLRVRALYADAASAPSNEVAIYTGIARPAPPQALLGAAAGSTLALSWTPPPDGGDADRLWLVVSGTLNGALPIPLADSFSFPGVPPGTYTVHIEAENAAGRSAASNPVTLTFPGTCSAAPAAPTNFRAWRSGSVLSIAWDPPTSGAPVTSYTVRAQGSVDGTLTTTRRLVSADAPPANYVISVTANSPCGASPPAPTAPVWTAVARRGGVPRVHWPATTPAPAGHRVFWSASRAALEAMAPSVSFVDVDQASGPADLTAAAGATGPTYYRVAGLFGPVAGPAGPVALAPTFQAREYTGWSANVTPALYDTDGDGCLDMVGARGRCASGFDRYDVASVGLNALQIDDKKNRDSRFADFTGDGIVDIFTNVYARADDPAVRAVLHVGRGDGTYVEDAGVAAMNLRGYGETVLAADFDNDGDVDLFLPHYTHRDDGGVNRLLVNDGAGHFTDVAATAGVATNLHHPPEGAQALDWDLDGWIDIHVASHLFRNNGNLTFTDIAPPLGLPVRFDEGLRLFDADLDGDLDLVHHDAHATRVHRNQGGQFDAGTVIDGSLDGSTVGFGLNVCDINGDGFEDLLVSNNDATLSVGLPHLLVNVGGRFEAADLTSLAPTGNDLLGCADLDGSGLPDVLSRWSQWPSGQGGGNPVGGFRTYETRGEAPGIRIRVVGASGAKNQQGRPVRLTPRAQPGLRLLRVVDSGSSYMAQNGYDLLVSTPWAGEYVIEVRAGAGWIRTTARPGETLTIYEDGRVTPGLK